MIGASTGGVEALRSLARGLPEALPAAVFVVLHTGASTPGRLAEILSRCGALVAEEARDGLQIRHGRIYVAPPDRHLLVLDGQMAVERGPKENGFRPAVDPLFRSAAAAYGDRVVGVILSGGLDDGTLGLKAIKERGGATIVQDPAEALAKGMPTSAIRGVTVDLVLRSGEIGPAIAALVGRGSERGRKPEGDPGRMAVEGLVAPGPPPIYTCQSGKLEDALWTSVRLMEENAAFLVRMAQRARDAKLDSRAGQHEKQSSLLRKRAEVIRSLLRKNTLRDLAASPAGKARPDERRKTGRRTAGKGHRP
jgi:two-component system chemotaxis response regulator CheB